MALRLSGGKGGFGSMLRAIGAQIEKTTNREACRDLTGRRLRAINDERRFRHYAKIKAQNKLEREERRRKKLESLAKSEPRHEFNDQEYINERTAIPERVEQALEDAFAEEAEVKPSSPPQRCTKEKLKGWIDQPDGFEDFEMDTNETSQCDAVSGDVKDECDNGKVQISNEKATDSAEKMEKDESTSIVGEEQSTAKETSSESMVDSKKENTTEKRNDEGDSNAQKETINDETKKQKNTATEVTTSTSAVRTEPLDLSGITSVEELMSTFSAEDLKGELSRLGVKCGGTPKERAERLWIVKDLKSEDIPKKLRAKK